MATITPPTIDQLMESFNALSDLIHTMNIKMERLATKNDQLEQKIGRQYQAIGRNADKIQVYELRQSDQQQKDHTINNLRCPLCGEATDRYESNNAPFPFTSKCRNPACGWTWSK